MNLIKFLYLRSKSLLLFATIASLISGISGAALVAAIGQAVGDTGVSVSLALMFFGACVLHLASKACSEISLLHLVQNAIFELRTTLCRKLLATPLKKLQSLGKDGLYVILTRDVDTFMNAFQLLPLAFGNVVIILVCMGYMAWLSWQLFVMFALCLIVSVVSYGVAERRPLMQLRKIREQMEILYEHFRSLIEGSKELQLNSSRGTMFIEGVITPGARNFKDLVIKSLSTYTWVQNVGTSIFYLVIGALLFVIPLAMPQPSGVLITVTLILLYLIRPIIELMNVLPVLRQAAIALTKIEQLNDSLPPAEPRRLGLDPFANEGPLRLELRGVCHHYTAATEDSQFMIGPLDLTIDESEIVFIVGGNGSGKTTLAMLLLGLYEAEQGVLKLNGVSVNDANRHEYRQYFSAVFADFHLFEQLLTSEREDLSARGSAYIELLQMSHKVKLVDGKFSTIDLSTGQRKRLALVSSYIEDRPLYLFDEWAADQDPAFKRVFYTELLPELKARGKTVIVITHDDSYFGFADRIIRLEDGHLKDVAVQDSTSPLAARQEAA